MTALDLWFEGEPRAGVIVADPTARARGDLGDAVADAPPRCLTWAPATSAADLDAFARLSPGWHGLVRVVVADWRGASPLAPWLASGLAAVLADVRRPLLVDPRGRETTILDEVHALSRAFPMLPLVVGLTPAIDPLLAARLATACPSVLLASGRVGDAGPLRELTRTGKVVHGSGTPWPDGAHAGTVELLPADAQTAEQLIAGAWRF